MKVIAAGDFLCSIAPLNKAASACTVEGISLADIMSYVTGRTSAAALAATRWMVSAPSPRSSPMLLLLYTLHYLGIICSICILGIVPPIPVSGELLQLHVVTKSLCLEVMQCKQENASTCCPLEDIRSGETQVYKCNNNAIATAQLYIGMS